MPTDPETKNIIEQVINDINKQVQDPSVDAPDVRQVLQKLTLDGGGIHVESDEFTIHEEHVDTVRDRAQSEYTKTHGIDGSTTKSLRFNNGLILSISNAKMATTNNQKIDMNEKTTVSVLAYFSDDIDISGSDYSTDEKQIVFDTYPEYRKQSRYLSDWLTAISRTEAEGRHFERVTESGDVDSPLFIDGPLFPPDILSWVIKYDRASSLRDLQNTPMIDYPEKINNILQSYINALYQCDLNRIPVYGVQKSTTATRVIDAILDKSDLDEEQMVWGNDSVLFNAALAKERQGRTISYTPWYLENKIRLQSVRGLVNPFENLDSIELPGYFKPEDLQRYFFFAKPPNQRTVIRIGVPKFVEDSWDLETIRDIALSEMAVNEREPHAVNLADQKVKISTELRENFRRLINEESNKTINEQRWGD